MGINGEAQSTEVARENELVHLLHPDLVGTLRGKAVRAADLDGAIATGIRWTPANIALTPLNVLAEPNPFGTLGDVRLHPDSDTEVRIPFADAPPLRFLLCDAREHDGEPWGACARSLLRRTLADFEAETGLRVLAAFEHEFQLLPPGEPQTPPFSLAGVRAVEPFASDVVAALDRAGAEPQMLIAEYGPDQYEITCAPSAGVAAADRALCLRTIVAELARRQGSRATFSPITDPAGVGNGVHIHLSFVDAAGEPAMRDPGQRSGVGELAGRFVAGVLAHARPLVAFTAPSPISAMRLGPNRWSASHAFLGQAHREALVRIPGQRADADPSELSLEFRAADATAAPHLALAAVVHAGLTGIRAGLEEAIAIDEDVTQLDAEELDRRGIGPLPDDLAGALDAVGEDGAFAGWLPDELWHVYLGIKRTELAAARSEEPADLLARYREFY